MASTNRQELGCAGIAWITAVSLVVIDDADLDGSAVYPEPMYMVTAGRRSRTLSMVAHCMQHVVVSDTRASGAPSISTGDDGIRTTRAVNMCDAAPRPERRLCDVRGRHIRRCGYVGAEPAPWPTRGAATSPTGEEGRRRSGQKRTPPRLGRPVERLSQRTERGLGHHPITRRRGPPVPTARAGNSDPCGSVTSCASAAPIVRRARQDRRVRHTSADASGISQMRKVTSPPSARSWSFPPL